MNPDASSSSYPDVATRLDIRDLYGRYNWHLDTRDTDGVAALFAPGATIVEPGPEVSAGDAAVLDVLRRWHADPSLKGRQHQVTNMMVDADPDGRADHWAVTTYFIVTEGAVSAPPSTLVWCGYSQDIVARVDGRMRFVVRKVGLWSEIMPVD